MTSSGVVGVGGGGCEGVVARVARVRLVLVIGYIYRVGGLWSCLVARVLDAA